MLYRNTFRLFILQYSVLLVTCTAALKPLKYGIPTRLKNNAPAMVVPKNILREKKEGLFLGSGISHSKEQSMTKQTCRCLSVKDMN